MLPAPGLVSTPLVKELNRLAGVLLAATRRTGTDGLSDAVGAFREFCQAMPAGWPHRGLALANMCQGLALLAERSGDLQHLVEALAAGDEAVAATPTDADAWPAVATNYANALRAYAERSGAWDGLQRAVELHRKALSGRGDDRRRSGQMLDFALTLWARFDALGEQQDLSEAVQGLRQVVDSADRDDPEFARYLTNLSAALGVQFESFGGRDALEEACAAARRATDLTPPDDPQWPGRLANLGSWLLLRFLAAGKRSDIDAAIDTYQTARGALDDGHSFLPRILSNLNVALLIRARAFSQLDDLAEAFRCGQQALRMVQPGDPHFADCASGLAKTVHALHSLTREPQYMQGALELVQAVTGDPAAPAADRVAAAERWGAWAAAASDDEPIYIYPAAEGYAAATSLLPLVAWHGLRRASREHQLRRWAEVTGLSAAYTVASGGASSALELLELGRTVMWRQLLDLRADFEHLQRADADLARRMTAVRTKLDALATRPAS